jgi:hypothetical protein
VAIRQQPRSEPRPHEAGDARDENAHPAKLRKCRAKRLLSLKRLLIAGKTKLLRFPGNGMAQGGELRFDARVAAVGRVEGWGVKRMASGRAAGSKVCCEKCFFHHNMLCAVSQAGQCATFRPNRPEGLRPPSQLRFTFRQERRMQVAWAFPSPAEQVALHG